MIRRIIPVLLLAILAVISVQLANTRSGLQFLLRFMPGGFEARIASGTLYHGFVLEDIRFETNGYRFSAARIVLNWQPWALLTNRIALNAVSIEDPVIILPVIQLHSAAQDRPPFPNLALSFSVEQLQLTSLTVSDQNADTILYTGPVRLSARIDQQVLDIEDLTIMHADARVSLSGRVELDAQLEHALSVAWLYPVNEVRRVVGTAEVSGDINVTNLSSRLNEPFGAGIELRIEDPFGDLAWAATVTAPDVDPAAYTDNLVSEHFMVEISARGTKNTASLEGTLQPAGRTGADVLQNAGYYFELFDAGFEVELQSILDPSRSAGGVIHWRQIDLLPAGQDRNLQFRDGQVRFEYAAHQFRFDSTSAFSLGNYLQGHWQATGMADRNSITVETLQLETAQGRLYGHVQLQNLTSIPDWAGTLNWEKLTIVLPSGQTLSLAGGRLASAGSIDAYTIQSSTGLALDSVPPAALTFEATGNRTGMHIEPLHLQLLDGRISGAASLDWTNQLEAVLDLSGADLDPGKYWQDWPGRIAVDAQIGIGNRAGPFSVELDRLHLEGQLRGWPLVVELGAAFTPGLLEIRQGRLGSGSSVVMLDGTLGTSGRLSWALDSPDLSQLHPQLAGRLDATGVVSGTTAEPELSATLSASAIRTPWGDIDRADGHFKIDEQIDVNLVIQQISAAQRTLDNLELDISGTLTAHRYQLNAGNDRFQLRSEGQATYANAVWQTSLDQLFIKSGGGDAEGWTADSTRSWEATMRLINLDRLMVDVADIGLDGQVRWILDDLTFMDSLGLPVTDMRGNLDLDLAIQGTLGLPTLSGRLLLADSAFIVPELGIEIEDIRIEGNTMPDGSYRLLGMARSGTGQFQSQTDIRTSAGGLMVASSLHGERVEFIHAPEMRAWASPDIHILMEEDHTRIEGTITIPEAAINLDEFRNRVSLSEDVILGDTVVVTPRRVFFDSDIELQFGDQIMIRGQGLTGRLTGKLNVYSNNRGELLGNGEVSILEGKFSAYGQSLLIEEGKLVFSDSRLDNPELRITAVRRIDDAISAGIRISGYASNPVITLFSTPTMNDDEILAYIVFGRPVTSLTSGEGSDLIGAATAMGLQNTGFLTRRISSTFGIDQLQFTSDATGQNAAVVIGKYLTPKLYVSYVMGLFESIASAQIRYDLNENWSLEVKSSTDVGVDLYYSIQK